MLPFALSIFAGAFLLFQVQPLIGKYILPWFGGTPGVWTTCLLFFQLVLLGGYAYAHWSTTRLKPRRQAMVHLALLLISLALLPIVPGETWKENLTGDPTWRVLLVLTATIGLPYFVLSATGPLLQQWFSQVKPGVSPYRLYALSNVGSLLALLTFPPYFEVEFSRRQLAVMWSFGLVAFALLCGLCAWLIWRRADATAPVAAPATPSPVPAAADVDAPREPTAQDRILWWVLPAIATALLLATTNKLCMEVAVIPFLWIAPLGLYLVSFIICFDHSRWYARATYSGLLVIAAGVLVHLIEERSRVPFTLQIAGYCGTLFVACMVCHGELYRLRPPTRLLTSYYLRISAGGALGGLAVAVVAPWVFNEFRELELGWWLLFFMLGVLAFRHRSLDITAGASIGAVAMTLAVPFMAALGQMGSGFWAELRELPGDALGRLMQEFWSEIRIFYSNFGLWIGTGIAAFFACTLDLRVRGFVRQWTPRAGLYVILLGSGFGAVLVMVMKDRFSTDIIHRSRNFYGTLKVYDYFPDLPDEHYRLLVHGATTHGLQYVNGERANQPTSYYGPRSGIGVAIAEHPRQQDRHIGVVGLGTGTMAAYGRAGDRVRFYDINADVEKLARSIFTYVDDTPAEVEIVMGDARISLERELAEGAPQGFDFLVLDAFSSDAIPVHLLTREALELYTKHMREGGIVAVHISNRFLDLQPVVETLAEDLGWKTVTVSDDLSSSSWLYRSTWVLVTKNEAFLQDPQVRDATAAVSGEKIHWTDDYSNLWDILR